MAEQVANALSEWQKDPKLHSRKYNKKWREQVSWSCHKKFLPTRGSNPRHSDNPSSCSETLIVRVWRSTDWASRDGTLLPLQRIAYILLLVVMGVWRNRQQGQFGATRCVGVQAESDASGNGRKLQLIWTCPLWLGQSSGSERVGFLGFSRET